MTRMTPAGTPRIVILGAGFAGLYLALSLAKALRRARVTAEVTLLDRNNYFLFSPLLHEATVGMVEMRHVAHPVRQCLRGTDIRFHETAVQAVDLDARTVRAEQGDYPYDVLVLALGSVTNYFGNDRFARYSFPMKTLGEAFRLRNHLLSVLELACEARDEETRRRLLTIMVAGAGFTGLETATELCDFLQDVLPEQYPRLSPAGVRLLVVDALPGLQVPSNPALAQRVLRLLRRKGIETRFNTPVRDAGPGWVELADGERIAAGTLVWTAGVRANPIVSALPLDKGSMQRLLVSPTLQVPGRPDVFALGDCACFTPEGGTPLIPTAQVANQQAPVAAENIVRRLTGQPEQPFVYHHMGELASLGLFNAVAEIGPLRLSGFPAWWVWRTVYLYKMPWWTKRARIAADWALDFLFARDTSRVEVDPCPACPARGLEDRP